MAIKRVVYKGSLDSPVLGAGKMGFNALGLCSDITFKYILELFILLCTYRYLRALMLHIVVHNYNVKLQFFFNL